MTAAGAFEFTVGDMVTELAQHYPKATATICQRNAQTHAEFFQRASRLADELAADGVSKGDRLLWLGQNCHRLLETVAAASLLGASLCPVNWRLSGTELQFIYSDLAPKVVFIQGADTLPDAKAFAGQLPPDQLAYFYDGAGNGQLRGPADPGSAAP